MSASPKGNTEEAGHGYYSDTRQHGGAPLSHTSTGMACINGGSARKAARWLSALKSPEGPLPAPLRRRSYQRGVHRYCERTRQASAPCRAER